MSVSQLHRPIQILNWLAALMILSCLALIFFYAPMERTMGQVQRIFYFHVGSAWTSSAAFFVALMAGILYLIRPKREWDAIAMASVEIGLIFTTITIASGSIWGRPAWNTWWIWSPRLTSITVLWLVYAAYFMLRGAIEDPDRRARYAAVYAIAGFVTVIITFYSIRLLRDIHPALSGSSADAQGEQDLTSPMVFTMVYSFLSFSVLYAAWLLNRVRLHGLQDEANALKARVITRLQTR
jgi:heme exporter protein C